MVCTTFSSGYDGNYPIVAYNNPEVLASYFRLTSYLKKKTYGDIIGHSTLDLAETFLAIVQCRFLHSYFGVKTAHVGLMLVFSEIGKALAGTHIFQKNIVVIIVVVGNIFVIVLETLLVIIHGLRLISTNSLVNLCS